MLTLNLSHLYKPLKTVNTKPIVLHLALLGFLSLTVSLCASAQESSTTAQPDEEPSVPEAVPLPEQSAGRASRPMWEFGIGGGYFSGFDYPASRDRNQRAVALPFFIYRTASVRFGGGGVRAVAIEKPRVKLDLSLGASLNSSSDGTGVRAGLPDLDFLFEIGPQLEMRLLDKPVASGGRLKARFTSELRAVFVTDLSRVGSQGWAAGMGVGLNYLGVRGSRVSLVSSLSLTFANERLQDYFYQVEPEFANPTRPEFDAKGGYLESRLFVGVGFQPLKNVRLFLGTFTEVYEGARNEDSPLFETTSETGFIAGFSWTIKTSDRQVQVVELGADN